MFNWLTKKTRRWRRSGPPDYLLLFLIFILLLGGLLMLSSASSDLGRVNFGNTFYFLKNQLLRGFLVGGVIALLIYNIDYRWLKKFSVPLLIITIILLIMVFSPLGTEQKGAARWLSFGAFSFQPSELAKFAFLIYLASWLSGGGRYKSKRLESFKEGFLPLLITFGILGFILLMQPATSIVAILLGSAVIVYFSAGGKITYISGLVLISVLATSLFIVATPYRRNRISSYFTFHQAKESLDLSGSEHHLNQALITIGSGGWTGVGFGKSVNKTKYLPEPIGDSIFAVIAEEFGYIGSLAVVLLFSLLVIRIFILARRHKDDFARLTMIGFGSIIGLQAFIHIGSNSGLIPLTGIPLPFVSYGSSGLVIILAMSALILNMSRYID